MERLTDAEELLDGPLDDPPTLAGNLRDLRRLNRLLGGLRLSRLALERLARATAGEAGAPERLTMLDVGTGGADIPVALLADARRRGRSLRITAIDARPEVLAAARSLRPIVTRLPELTMGASDGRSLPFGDDAFDVAHSSLVVHHLRPEAAVVLFREMARVASRGVIVNDLARARIHWLGALLVSRLLTRNRYSRHDAPLSVRRAYTAAEMRDLLGLAGLRPIFELGGPFGHRYAIGAVRA